MSTTAYLRLHADASPADSLPIKDERPSYDVGLERTYDGGLVTVGRDLLRIWDGSSGYSHPVHAWERAVNMLLREQSSSSGPASHRYCVSGRHPSGANWKYTLTFLNPNEEDGRTLRIIAKKREGEPQRFHTQEQLHRAVNAARSAANYRLALYNVRDDLRALDKRYDLFPELEPSGEETKQTAPPERPSDLAPCFIFPIRSENPATPPNLKTGVFSSTPIITTKRNTRPQDACRYEVDLLEGVAERDQDAEGMPKRFSLDKSTHLDIIESYFRAQ